MKLSPLQLVAASVAGTFAVIGIGVSIHSASVHEQNCLSYERQLTTDAVSLKNDVTRMSGIYEAVQANPIVAFGEVGNVFALKNNIEQTLVQVNNKRYAYTETCGDDRYNRFRARPDIAGITNYLTKTAAKLS
jgi:hypothetical protein